MTRPQPELKYRGLRFPRTASEAFRDHTYGAAIERPERSSGLGRWLIAIAALALLALAGRG